MITRLDKEIIRRVRSRNIRIQSHIKNTIFREQLIMESDRIEWDIFRDKEVSDGQIIFWGRARRNKEFWYPKYWKKNRYKMVRYNKKYDLFNDYKGQHH